MHFFHLFQRQGQHLCSITTVPFRITDSVSDVAASLCQCVVQSMANYDLSDKIPFFVIYQPESIFTHPIWRQVAFLSVTIKFRKNITGRCVRKGICCNVVINIFVMCF